MSQKLPTPPVPDLARARGETVSELVEWFVEYHEEEGCPWSYRTGTKIAKTSYRGLHRLDLLVAGCTKEKTKQGRKSNRELVELAAPLAFGRSTQVFDLPPRRFHFGRNRNAGYRIPFFFVESGVVKIYFLQPRKNNGPEFEDLGMVATIQKKFLLDTEFYGLPVDVEFVDLSCVEKGGPRICRSYSLDKLQLWSEKRLTDRLTAISEALDTIDKKELVTPRRRIWSRPEPEMPLFD
jgi:hypothetical protein